MKLLERNAPLDVLMSALRAASSGEGKLVVVSGEAGIGKTSLVEHFLREQRFGLRAASGCCEPLRATRPLAPFQEIARQLGGSILAFFDGHIAQQRALPELLESFARRPTILVLEDVHWADDASIDVIRFLGRRIQSLPLLMVVTHRDDELEHAHPLRGMLASLATSPAIQRIALERLSADAVRQLADTGPFDADDIYRRTEGNPFLVAEILSGGDIRAVPIAVRDLTVDRMAWLSADGRRIAQIAAVSGRPEATLLRMLSPGASEQTQACIEIGLFREDGGAVAFGTILCGRRCWRRSGRHCCCNCMPRYSRRSLARERRIPPVLPIMPTELAMRTLSLLMRPSPRDRPRRWGRIAKPPPNIRSPLCRS